MLGEDISESGAKGKVSNTDPIGHGLSFISSKAWTRHACSFLVEGTCFSGRSPLGMDGASEGHLLRQLHFVPLQVQSSILGCSSSSGLLHPAVLSHCHSGGPTATSCSAPLQKPDVVAATGTDGSSHIHAHEA